MLADRIGAQMGASTIYGTPVERDDVTVIPVAAARFGIGAGSGSDPSKRQEGEGGGGGGTITPAGYIELKDGRSRFVPIVHSGRMLALVCGAIVAGLAIMRPAVARAAHKRVALALNDRAARARHQRSCIRRPLDAPGPVCRAPALPVPLDPRERQVAELDPLRLVDPRRRPGGAQLLH
jgi:uncharacterized spore protein YtfJ